MFTEACKEEARASCPSGTGLAPSVAVGHARRGTAALAAGASCVEVSLWVRAPHELTGPTRHIIEAEPGSYGILDVLQLDGRKCSDGPDQSSVRYRYQALRIKGSRLQESCRDDDFKLRPSHARRVRDQSDKSTIRLASTNTRDHARADFRSKTEIDKPNFTAWR